MCFTIAIDTTAKTLEKRFNAVFDKQKKFERIFYANAFAFPPLPVITNTEPKKIHFYNWGLIPFWVKDEKTAESIRTKTGNAKAETIHDKPSFRQPIMKKRCLILTTGFFEWRLFNKKNYPYYIRMKDHKPFALAGIWDTWKNPKTNKAINTFSIITTKASPLLAKIHNKKKRMPVILEKENEKVWLNEKIQADEIDLLMDPFDDKNLEAYTISKMISMPRIEKNVPEILKPFEYTELKAL